MAGKTVDEIVVLAQRIAELRTETAAAEGRLLKLLGAGQTEAAPTNGKRAGLKLWRLSGDNWPNRMVAFLAENPGPHTLEKIAVGVGRPKTDAHKMAGAMGALLRKDLAVYGPRKGRCKTYQAAPGKEKVR